MEQKFALIALATDPHGAAVVLRFSEKINREGAQRSLRPQPEKTTAKARRARSRRIGYRRSYASPRKNHVKRTRFEEISTKKRSYEMEFPFDFSQLRFFLDIRQFILFTTRIPLHI